MKKAGLIICLVFLVLLSGCKNKEQPESTGKFIDKSVSDKAKENVKNDMSASHWDLGYYFDSACESNGKAYGVINNEDSISVYTVDITSGELCNEYKVDGAEKIGLGVTFCNNRISVLGLENDELLIWTIDEAGTITENAKGAMDMGEDTASIKSFYYDSEAEGYVIVYETAKIDEEASEKMSRDVYESVYRIYIFDEEMNIKTSDMVGGSYGNDLIALFHQKDGNVSLLCMDDNGYYCREAGAGDTAKKYLEQVNRKILYDIQSSKIRYPYKQSVIYYADGSMNSYDVLNNTSESVFRIDNGGLYDTDVQTFFVNDDGYGFINYYERTGNSEYTLFSERNESQKTILTLGTSSAYEDLRRLVADYNRYQDKSEIHIVDYIDDYESSSEMNQYTKDILSGAAPDIICSDIENFDILQNAGAFANLYTFMDNDSELNKDAFVSSVLKAYEIKGELCCLGAEFWIYTIFGPKSVVNGKCGVSPKEMIDIVNANGGSINSILGIGGGDEPALTSLSTVAFNDYIDWNASTCSFSDEEYRSLLEFVKEYNNEGPDYESLYDAKHSRIILLSVGCIRNVADYSLESAMYGEPIEFIGFPSKHNNGSTFIMGMPFAISKSSKHQSEAWDFIKYYVAEAKIGSGSAFSIIKDKLEKQFSEAVQVHLSEGEDAVEPVSMATYSEKGKCLISVEKATDADVEAVRNIIESTSAKYEYIPGIMSIIEEESAAFLAGQKSVEVVTDLIENRVNIYLSEHN